MTELSLHNHQIQTIFELLGKKENDLTYAVGWAFYRCPSFLRQFLKSVAAFDSNVGEVVIRLQDFRKNQGITDVEVELPGKFHLIVEAKDGWTLPGETQLGKYCLRLQERKSPIRKIVALTACSDEYALCNLGFRAIDNIPVEPISWKRVIGMARRALPHGSNAEKRLLRELLDYFGEIMSMQDIDSNWVYVVAVGNGTHKGWKLSWRDIVEKKHRYFHSMGTHG